MYDRDSYIIEYNLENEKLGIVFNASEVKFEEIKIVDISTMEAIKEANDILEDVLELLDKYEKLGPLPGILLPFIEAFLPFLPLFVFVMANSAAYGLFKGFIYSWFGAAAGSIAVFFLIRKFGNKKI